MQKKIDFFKILKRTSTLTIVIFVFKISKNEWKYIKSYSRIFQVIINPKVASLQLEIFIKTLRKFSKNSKVLRKINESRWLFVVKSVFYSIC